MKVHLKQIPSQGLHLSGEEDCPIQELASEEICAMSSQEAAQFVIPSEAQRSLEWSGWEGRDIDGKAGV